MRLEGGEDSRGDSEPAFLFTDSRWQGLDSPQGGPQAMSACVCESFLLGTLGKDLMDKG